MALTSPYWSRPRRGRMWLYKSASPTGPQRSGRPRPGCLLPGTRPTVAPFPAGSRQGSQCRPSSENTNIPRITSEFFWFFFLKVSAAERKRLTFRQRLQRVKSLHCCFETIFPWHCYLCIRIKCFVDVSLSIMYTSLLPESVVIHNEKCLAFSLSHIILCCICTRYKMTLYIYITRRLQISTLWLSASHLHWHKLKIKKNPGLNLWIPCEHSQWNYFTF